MNDLQQRDGESGQAHRGILDAPLLPESSADTDPVLAALDLAGEEYRQTRSAWSREYASLKLAQAEQLRTKDRQRSG